MTMASATARATAPAEVGGTVFDTRISQHPHTGVLLTWGVVALLAVGLVYTGISLYDDLVGEPAHGVLPYLLLGVALVIALGFASSFAS